MKMMWMAALAAGMLTSTGAVAQTTIVFQDMGAEREGFNEEAIRLFEEANPEIDVEYRWQANEPYKTGIKVMMESNNPPDLYFVWAGSFSNDFVDAGIAADLSESQAAGDPWTEGAAMGVVDQFRYKDGLYGVPGQVYTKYMWKNDAFFADKGLEVPGTIDETLALCARIREIDPLMTPIAFGASESWTINHYLTILFQRHVPQDVAMADFLLTADADALWTDPGYEAALEDFVRLLEGGCFNDGINSVDPNVSRTMFAQELAAMTFCGSWCPPIFDEQGFAGKYSAFPFPAVEGGRGDQAGGLVGTQGFQVAEASGNKSEAIRLMSWLLSPEMQALQARTAGQLPANASALQDGDLPEVSVDLLQRVAALPVSVPPLNTIVETSVSDVILKSGQDLAAGTITPAEFMKRVRAQAAEAQARG